MKPESKGNFRLTLSLGKRLITTITTITLINGKIQIECENRFKDAFERLLLHDFDEIVGMPPMRMRAKQGTLEALDCTAEYFSQTLKFTSRLELLPLEP
jgi:hypothetical protein